MAHFEHDFIDLRLPRSGNIRTTMSQLTFFSDIVDNYIVVPIGTHTDLGSIPTVLQWLFPKDGKAVLGYVLHDHLYKNAPYNRGTCDDILQEAMKVLGVSWWRRKSVRGGLRVGGWVAWNSHRKRDKNDKS